MAAEPAARVLVVEDDPLERRMYSRALGRAGLRSAEAGGREEAHAALADGVFDVALVDVRLPDGNGLELCREIRERAPRTLVVLITGHAEVADAVTGLKLGASDYLQKPCPPDIVLRTVDKALAERRTRDENERLRERIRQSEGAGQLLGTSAAMAEVRRLIDRASGSEQPVLIVGESGTGKELVAQAIHSQGPRAAASFVAVNASAIHRDLFERELFGHERGAFTGAETDRPGLFEAADGGTVFLDEISEMAPGLQPKLLRVLEEGTIRRVGGVDERPVDVRTVSATNRDLVAEIEAGRFREDLYYRLESLVIRTPPLRERPEDVDVLAAHFLDRARRRSGAQPRSFGPGVLAMLRAEDWPGNVRQLANWIERAALVVDAEQIEVADLEQVRSGARLGARRGTAEAYPYRDRSLEDMERMHVKHVLEACGGNRTRAAEVLGISRTTLWNRLRAESEDRESAGAGLAGGVPID